MTTITSNGSARLTDRHKKGRRPVWTAAPVRLVLRGGSGFLLLFFRLFFRLTRDGLGATTPVLPT